MAQALGPFFILLSLGIFLGRIHFLNESWKDITNSLIFYITLPALIFLELSRANLQELLDLKLFGIVLGGVIVFFIFLWLISKVISPDPTVRGPIIQGGFRSNVAIIGFPIIFQVLGQRALGLSVVLLAFLLPLFNLLSVLALTVPGGKFTKKIFLSNSITLLKNPLLLSTILGLLFHAFTFPLPKPLVKSLEGLSQLTFPLSLLILGMSLFAETKVKRQHTVLFLTVFFKNLLMPFFFGAVLYLFGYRELPLVTVILIMACPTAVASFSMTKAMKQDATLAGNIVVLSTAFSLLSLTGFVIVLKLLKWV